MDNTFKVDYLSEGFSEDLWNSIMCIPLILLKKRKYYLNPDRIEGLDDAYEGDIIQINHYDLTREDRKKQYSEYYKSFRIMKHDLSKRLKPYKYAEKQLETKSPLYDKPDKTVDLLITDRERLDDNLLFSVTVLATTTIQFKEMWSRYLLTVQIFLEIYDQGLMWKDYDNSITRLFSEQDCYDIADLVLKHRLTTGQGWSAKQHIKARKSKLPDDPFNLVIPGTLPDYFKRMK